MGALRRGDAALRVVHEVGVGALAEDGISCAGSTKWLAEAATRQDIYLVGGARTVAGLIDAGLVDELRLTVYPLLVGPGKALFATTERRRGLELRDVQRLQSGRVSHVYELA